MVDGDGSDGSSVINSVIGASAVHNLGAPQAKPPVLEGLGGLDDDDK